MLVLLGLSIAGVLSGMLFRVRSFLYLGFTFLLVDLSVMVYHASWDLGQMWVLYGTGVVVGSPATTRIGRKVESAGTRMLS